MGRDNRCGSGQGDACCIVGGPIVSLQHSNRAKHTLTLGASCFDVIRLAERDYHIGMDGVEQLTNKLIQDCG
jgi:hypothetical protein